MTAPIDWSKYLTDKDSVEEITTETEGSFEPSLMQPPTQQEPISQPAQEEIDFSQYETKEEPGLPQVAAETGAQALTGLISPAIGGYGDIRDISKSLGQYMGTKAGEALRGFIGKEPLTEEQSKEAQVALDQKSYLDAVTSVFPTTQEVSESFEELPGGYLKPSTDAQRKIKDIATDVGTLFNPLLGKMSLAKATGSALFGEGAQQIVKMFGASEKTQNLVKAGATFLSSIFNPGAAKKHAADLLQKSYKHIKPDDVISSIPLIKDTRHLLSEIKLGGVTPDKSVAMNLVKQFEKDLLKNPNTINPIFLPKYRTSVNELRFSKGLGSQKGGLFPKSLPPKTQHFLNKFDDILNSGLETYGKNNPTFLNAYREGNLALSGLAKSNTLQNTISKNVDLNQLSPDTLMILGLHAGPGAVAAGGGLATLAKTTSLMRRVATTRPLRKYYLNVLKYGALDNAQQLKRNLKFLDKEMKETD